MTELLFGLTVVFVAYVIYEVYKTISETDRTSGAGVRPPPSPAAPLPSASSELPAAEPEQAPPEPEAEAVPEPSPVRSGGEATPAKATASGEKPGNLRNPATGEVAPVPANYRFAKKWIKDALVAEGLLDRVYKPNELDASVSRTVKEALEKLRRLEKYRA